MARRAGIEAFQRIAEDEFKCGMTGFVADRVRIDFGRTDPVEQANGVGAAEKADGAGIMCMEDGARRALADQIMELRGDPAERFLPGDGLELALALGADALQGRGEPEGLLPPGAIIGDRAFAAERAPTDGVILVTEHIGDDPALFIYGETAGVVAIARTSGFDNVLLQHRRR